METVKVLPEVHWMSSLRSFFAAPQPLSGAGFEIRWGRVRQMDCRLATSALSILAAWGGTQVCRVSGRSVVVDDDSYLIVNPGCTRGIRVRAEQPVEALAISFGPAWTHECQRFVEHLQPHDSVVSPVLRYLRAHLQRHLLDERWYQEQLAFLLERMVDQQQRIRRSIDLLALTRPATRHEVYRRVGLATDYLHACYSSDVSLDMLSRIACLSKFHLLRLFRLVHGVTPRSFLQRKRVGVATRLLETTDLAVSDIAARVGISSASTLLRLIRARTGLTPRQFRNRSATNSQSTQLSHEHTLLA